MTQRLLSLLFCLSVLACTQGPDLPGTLTDADRNAPFPNLVPLSQVQALAGQASTISPESVAQFDSRIANLRARAGQLTRRPIIEQGTRRRMQAAIARAALR
ncbi:MAG: hypothetical protein AAFP98_08540 [Pseudomonadota bacterium]